jgi:hypothetical protein
MASIGRRPFLLGSAAAATVLGAGAARAEVTEVDMQLIMAADVSRSVEQDEFELQRGGYAQAFRDPRVVRAIRSGPLGRIGVSFLEWSGEYMQAITVPWGLVGDDESAASFAAALEGKKRPFADRTSIGEAVDFAQDYYKRSPFRSQRRVIDVSGDGTNTNGMPPTVARDQAVNAGFTINGIVILSPDPQPWNAWHTHPPGGLDEYYRRNVVGGPGAFVMVAEDFTSFAHAIVNKLIREIAGAPTGPTAA